MKKLLSLIKASMTSDMALFKIKTKSGSRRAVLIPVFIALYLMFMIWGGANSIFEKLYPMNIAYLFLSTFVFSISIMTFCEGIYKSGSLIFNCKDDQLLLSLPIKRITVLFIRIFKFYVFELLFNSLFLLPIMIAYIRWDSNITWTYYLSCFVMLLLLPIIPIVLSCIIGVITSSFASRFKYKNAFQIIIALAVFLGIFYLSYSMENVFNYLVQHSNGINDFVTKIYYPAGVFTTLVTDFNLKDLLIFILVNIGIFTVSIFILSKFYFKINSRMKSISTSTKKVNTNKLTYKTNSQTKSLMKKEINTFFKTPVFFTNAGFALVIFIIAVIAATFKFDSFIESIVNYENDPSFDKNYIMNNLSTFVFILITVTSFMTSITNSVISLEGRNINILKSLPVKVKTILMSKACAPLLITTPVLLIGDIILFFKFNISIVECLLLIALSIIMPMVSNLIGIIINLKYPKLDWDNPAEAVKQSASSFIAVLIGMLLLIGTVMIGIKLLNIIRSVYILLMFLGFYTIVDIVLYIYLVNYSVKDFNKLAI